jgi:phage gpG-like protein
VILGNGVVSTIGSNVVYAAIHEFGGVIQRTVMAGVIRVKTNKAGKLARQGKNGKLLVFAGRKTKYFTHIASKGASYTITIPARAPFGHGIADRLPDYQAAFEKVTEEFLGGDKN